MISKLSTLSVAKCFFLTAVFFLLAADISFCGAELQQTDFSESSSDRLTFGTASKSGNVSNADVAGVSILSAAGEQVLVKAQRYMDEGCYDYAVDELTKALSKEQHSDLYWYLGNAWLGAGERKLAWYAFRRSWDGDKTNTDVLSSLTDLSVEFGKLKDCESLLPFVQKELPEITDRFRCQILLKKADKCFDDKRYIRAFHLYDEVLSADSSLFKPAEEGCIKSLKTAAQLLKDRNSHEKTLKVLLRLYHFEPSVSLADDINKYWQLAGSPADYSREVMSVKEHSMSLQ